MHECFSQLTEECFRLTNYFQRIKQVKVRKTDFQKIFFLKQTHPKLTCFLHDGYLAEQS